MKIWVDIANSPQVLLMSPIIKEFKRRGYEVVVTTRRQYETVSLADEYRLEHTVIGAHGGKSFIGKGVAIFLRVINLIWFIRKQHIDLAVSGSSYAHAVAAALTRIPYAALNDYEGNPAMNIVCRVARKILVPNVFLKENLLHYGAKLDNIESYSGMKENIYLSEFVPDPDFLKKAGLPEDKILVTMRPASEGSAYHQFKNPLFEVALGFISRHPDTCVIVLSRNSEQRANYESMGLSNVIFPKKVLDGPNLVYYSDLIVGGGGTMNREAVVLGTPVYSIFLGLMGSIDRHLIDSGKMYWINNEEGIRLIRVAKKTAGDNDHNRNGQDLVSEVVDKLLAAV